jgi:5-deoxy-glucuronate isomerase
MTEANPMTQLHLPAGTAAANDDQLLVTPESAGWDRCGLRIMSLPAGGSRTLASGADELAVLPLSGGACTVEVEGARFALAGRETVFARVTDWAYIPTDAEVRLSSPAGCELALASSRATRRFDPAYVEAASIPIELRGSGPATRQVINFMTPEFFDGADRLICCELLTPDGNWSSYPPHKHDATPECEVDNEEIYYFRVGRLGTVEYSREGFAIHRTYTDDRSIDETVVVRDGDAFLIPAGYHGPCIAAPGYPLYYLNVMASDSGPRKLAFVDDAPHHWVRATWDDMPLDPRLPMTSAAGLVGARR